MPDPQGVFEGAGSGGGGGGGGGTSLAGDVINPPGNNRVVQLRGDVATSTVNEQSGVTISQTQGGTLAVPRAETPLSFQPRDPAKSPYQFRLIGGLFNATVDAVLQWGYNPAGTAGTEPLAYDALEQDYESVPGTHIMERYFQCQFFDASHEVRPFYCSFDRASGKTLVSVTWRDGGGFAINGNTDGQFIQWNFQDGQANIDPNGHYAQYNVTFSSTLANFTAPSFGILASTASGVYIGSSAATGRMLLVGDVAIDVRTRAFGQIAEFDTTGSPVFYPNADAGASLGTTANRWNDVESVSAHTTQLGSSSASVPFDFVAQSYSGTPLAGTQAVDKTKPRINLVGTITSGGTYTLDFGNTSTGFYIIDISQLTSSAIGTATLALKNGTDTDNITISSSPTLTADVLVVLLATNNVAVNF